MQQVCGGLDGVNPQNIQSFEGCCLQPSEEDRGARRHVSQKATGIEGAYGDEVAETEGYMSVHIDRLGRRLLRCGVCRQRCRKVHSVRKAREWRDLSMRNLTLKLRYRPRRVECPRCGLRVEDCPWAEPWSRVITTLFHA